MDRISPLKLGRAQGPNRRAAFALLALFALLTDALGGGDILRPSVSTATGTAAAAAPSNPSAGAAGLPTAVAKLVSNSQDLLAKTTAALGAVNNMQAAARSLALSGSDSLRTGLLPVPENSYLVPNGLVPAAGVPQNLANPLPSEDPSLWTGANLPTLQTGTINGNPAEIVTIQQTQQQAVLNWQTFNIGRSTTLNFDQSLGGADVGEWVAFNKIGVTGSPSQILGSISAQGQVYVINPNGIIFGGSSQVNTHALVASSLPINDNLINDGLLNNPDTQFLFSALPIPAGTNGTPAFTPTISDQFVPSSGSHTLALNVESSGTVTVSYVPAGSPATTLVAGTDYTYTTVATPGGAGTQGVVTFNPSGLQKAAGSIVNVTYTPAGDQFGNVEVQAGAQLTAPSIAGNIGGRVMLVGPNVTNNGTITTPDGQAILAAGLQVGIDSHPSTDPSLRGLDVFVGSVVDPSLVVSASAGTATNGLSALIEAPRADVTIVGSTVNQAGFIDSSTSVSFNGRIDLLAEYDSTPNSAAFDNPSNSATTTPPFTPTETGVVTLGADSVTQIVPEESSTATIVGTQLALSSIVDIRGLAIHLASSTDSATGSAATVSGAVIYAPSAGPAVDENGNLISESNTRIPLASGVTLAAGDWSVNSPGFNDQTEEFVNDRGQVYLDAGTAIDVSGSQNVTASVSEDNISVQLRGTELANSPLQQNGPLRGQTVQVSLLAYGDFNGAPWVGTPVGDTSGYVGLIQRSVGELTSAGGSVSITAGNSVVIQPSATINVSGGWINYQGADITTTQVLTQGGQILDISQATPNIVYQGIYTGTTTTTDPKWNVSQSSANPLPPGTTNNPGFIQGGNAGSVAIDAPTMALDGQFYGNTVEGQNQRLSESQINSTFGSNATFLGTMEGILGVPTAGTINLSFKQESLGEITSSPTPPNISFVQPPTGADAAAPFDFDVTNDPNDLLIAGARGIRGAEIDLSPTLVNVDGFDNVTVDNSGGTPAAGSAAGGSITVPKGTTLNAAPGSDISLQAANIDVEGTINAPGGILSLTALDFSPLTGVGATPAPDPTRGQFTLGAGGSLSTAGLIVDDRPTALAPLSLPMITSGGQITIDSYSAAFQPGSLINASGGLDIQPSGKQIFGNGGAIAILAGQDPLIPSIIGGTLDLNVVSASLGTTLMGYSGPGATGGSITIKAPLVQVGGSVLQNGDANGVTFWLNPTDDTGKLLGPDFFSQGGFASISLIGIGAVDADANPVDPAGPSMIPGIYIASGTVNAVSNQLVPTEIAPEAANWMSVPDPNNPGAYTLAVDPEILPVGQRSPVKLSFQAKGVTDPFLSVENVIVRGDLIMEAGSVISTDPQTNPGNGVALTGNTVTLLGSVTAPGGTIAVAGSSNPTFLFGQLGESEPLPTVDIGPDSILDAEGTTVLTPNSEGLRTGTVLPGGIISISGNIVAEKGSILNVSGWSDTNDSGGLLYVPNTASTVTFPTPIVAPETFVPNVIQSGGGTIDLLGGHELYVESIMIGAAGGPFAQGGTLVVSSGKFYPLTDPLSPASTDVSLVVTASGSTLPKAFDASGTAVIGTLVDPTNIDPVTNDPADNGHISASIINGAGFDWVTLGGTQGALEFLGSSTISAARGLIVGGGGVVAIASTPTDSSPTAILDAPYVAIGSPFRPPLTQFTSSIPNTIPTTGTGTLEVNASALVDVGDLSLQGIGAAVLSASAGDIRGNGTFDIAGVATLSADQVYPTTAGQFTVVAYDYTPGGGSPLPGTVNVLSPANEGLPQMPLSAGGQLNIYASDIIQQGVLRAPVGAINLGWDGGSTSAPIDLDTGQSVPTSQVLKLLPGSVTTVSASDPLLSEIPYGINLNGTAWIDPTGVDITSGGVPGKSVVLQAAQIQDVAGAKIDINGGGDLYAYQWISGTGGTNDLLSAASASLTSFAVIPGYQPYFSPYAPYSTQAQNLGSDPGYVASATQSIKVGDQVYLNAAGGLPAGTYTVLPARYALLPGALLITPESGTPPAKAVAEPDGTSVVSGYMVNALNPLGPGYNPQLSSFVVVTGTVVRTESQYADFSANIFLSSSALTAGAAPPRLPQDGGQLVLSAMNSLMLGGTVASAAAAGGQGGLVDISSVQDIEIGTTAPQGTLLLDPTNLSNFGAASLLIGGIRQSTPLGTSVEVTAGNITVDNAGAPLTGSDIILAANDSIAIEAGSAIEQTASLSGSAETLLLNGNGVLVRVASDPSAQVVRTGVTSSSIPTLTVGANAQVTGASVNLDSTDAATLDSSVILGGASSSVTLGSGQISIQLSGAGPLRTQSDGTPTTGLVLTVPVIQNLENSSSSLALVSYSSIDLYGSGTVGSPTFSEISLHAPEIYGDGAIATFAAKTIQIDNNSNGTGPDALAVGTAASGALGFDANTIELGSNAVNVQQYASLNLNASGSLVAIGTGGLATQGNLNIATPVVEASALESGAGGTAPSAAPAITLAAAGALNLIAPSSGPAPSQTGSLGASLTLVGNSVNIDTAILLASGSVSAHALGSGSSGSVAVGNAAILNVGGVSSVFNGANEFTSGGTIALQSDNGSVAIANGATLNLTAQPGGGNGGTLDVEAPKGLFTMDAGTAMAQGGVGGENGQFSLDVSQIPGAVANTSSLGSLGGILSAGGFTQSVAIRVRTGDVVVDGTLKADGVSVSADSGAVTVDGTGMIDASGATGGSIDLSASGSVTLDNGSILTVKGANYSDAGQGGTVTLDAGSATNGTTAYTALGKGPQLNIQTGSTIDLSITNNLPIQLDYSGSSSISVPANTPVALTTGTPGDDEITLGSAGTITTATGATISFAAGYTTAVAPGTTIVLSSPGTLAFSTGGTGGPIPVNLSSSAVWSGTGVTNLSAYSFTGTLTLEAPQAVSSSGKPIDVQVATIGGTIIDPSSIVVAGFHEFNPVAGVIDTVETQVLNNGADFAGGLDSTGTLQTGNAAAITQRLFSGNANFAALVGNNLIHVEPGAEIINPSSSTAATTITLNNNGSSLSIPGNTAIEFPNGGAELNFSTAGVVTGGAGTLTSPSGAVAAFAAGSNPAFPAGSSVTLSGAGSVTLGTAGTLELTGSSGRVVVSLPASATYGVAGADGATVNAANGVGLTLSNSGSSPSSLTVNGGVEVVFPEGVPSADNIKSSQAGIVTASSGAKTTFAANSTNISIPDGATLVLKAAGTLTFVSGTVPIPLSLAAGTYTTNGDDSLAISGGSLTLASSWDLSTYRFGDIQTGLVEPGILILRASGNLVFDYGASLSDGFTTTPASTPTTTPISTPGPTPTLATTVSPLSLWTAPLMPTGSASWTYELVAGADMGAADPSQVMPYSVVGSAGSVLIGAGAPAIPTAASAITRLQFFTQNPAFYQTIRSGTGDINIYAAQDVQLLNPLATVYTAGTQAPTMPGFDTPVVGGLTSSSAPTAEPPYYPAQYSYGGGNVTITAQGNIGNFLQTSTGLVVESAMELPSNWLYRRGALDSGGSFATTLAGDVASTTWWVDFSNFFEDVGALGGGNVSLTAGQNIINVDAVAPTNARMTSVDASGNPLTAPTALMVELGGGNVTVSAGNDISGGIYYVERGQGALSAGGDVTTNSARAALSKSELTSLAPSGGPDPVTWLPTTLFLGQGSFTVAANGSVLLGPVSNAFLLPEGTDNGFYDKSYFSTYAFDDAISVSSLVGSITLQDNADSANYIEGDSGGAGSLASWIANVLFQPLSANTANRYLSFSEPWLKLDEASGTALSTLEAVMPPSLNATAFNGSINLVGNITLSPAPNGALNLLAAGSVNGTQPNGIENSSIAYNSVSNPYVWDASIVDLSDANPNLIPSVLSPLGFANLPKAAQGQTSLNETNAIAGLNTVFADSGATSGLNVVLETEQKLHGVSPSTPSEPLHYGDPNPVVIDALSGNVSGFTMYAAKSADVLAGTDITDIALYIQNVATGDVSTVAAGRDITAYDPGSPLRLEASSPGNEISFQPDIVGPGSAVPQAGDIQISGPGTLEVFAGRNLNLGTGSPVTSDGLATGITSVGNTRNPLLPFAGANLVVGAGIDAVAGIDSSALDFSAFTSQFLNPSTAGAEALEHLPELAGIVGVTYDSTNPQASDMAVWNEFETLPESQQHLLDVNMFYLVLRDAGRDRNNTASPNYGNYNAGYEAIAALFGSRLDFTDSTGTGFEDLFLNPTKGGAAAATYLNDLAPLIGDAGDSGAQVWSNYLALPTSQQQALALDVFSQVLTDAAKEAGQPSTAAAGNLLQMEALAALFNGQGWNGNISMSAHEIATTNGGDISVLAPGGQITVGLSTDKQTPQVGILTQQGGNVSIFANGTVSLGTSRIFTLEGGNEIIWSTTGNIAAGSGSKTVHSAPPTRVLVNPQSADVENDLAGLATGSGIGVLATLSTVAPGNVDLIAPVGIVDAGDAGIRASGNLNIAAHLVLNASNIQVGGSSAGLPPPPAPPNLAPFAAASAASAASASSAAEVANQSSGIAQAAELPSIISVDVLGYGGSEDDDSNSMNNPGNDSTSP
jgi:filamentous hemagglutinin family protein